MFWWFWFEEKAPAEMKKDEKKQPNCEFTGGIF